ncbi:hypothetical protein F4860DRAFT_518345 [Xylaria cubensis]|nr:hypothetical protein F4860DRAFT_518345 [Xylaria cubensis]
MNGEPIFEKAITGRRPVIRSATVSTACQYAYAALHGATLREHNTILKILVEACADPSQADYNVVALLHITAIIGNLQILKLLLDYGAPNRTADSLGETPYDWAVKAGQIGSRKCLREKRANWLTVDQR